MAVSGLEVDGVVFPPVARPPGSGRAHFLAGAGVRGMEIGGNFIKFTAIGVYLEDAAVPALANKWAGKTADELAADTAFFRDVVTGEFEKFTRVTMILPLTGEQYSEKRYSAIGKAARATLSTPHTTGSKSYARVRDEHAQKKGKEPGRIEFFTITHTRKSGRLDDNAAKFVDDASNMVRNVSSAPGCSQSIVEIENQVYAQLMDKGTKVTGFGTGVTSEEVSGMQVDARNALPYGENQSEKDENFKLQMAEMKKQYDLGLAEMQNQCEDRISRMEAEHTAVQIEQASKYSALQAQVDHLMNVMMTSAMPPNQDHGCNPY